MIALDQLENTELADHSSHDGLVEQVDLYRAASVLKLDPEVRAEIGPYPTPLPVAPFNVYLFDETDDIVSTANVSLDHTMTQKGPSHDAE